MKLTVRSRFDADMKDDMVRIDRAHRNGIRSGRICKLEAIDNNSDGAITRYVEVRGIGTTLSDLMPYLEQNPNEPQDRAAYTGSVFMDESTRIRFYLDLGKEYQFRISRAGLLGNLRYFIAHPDRYGRTLAWVGIIGVILGVGGYSLKDYLTPSSPPSQERRGPGTGPQPPIPPDRLLSAQPFRIRLDDCAASSCDIRIYLKGYDPEGRLRYEASNTFSNLIIGQYRDSNLMSVEKMYFVPGQEVTFQMYCRSDDGPVIAGEDRSVDWKPADEPHDGWSEGYAVWLSCGNDQFKVSIGIGVGTAKIRLNEPAVKPDTGPPKNAPQSSIAGKKFYIGTVTADDGGDAAYTRSAKEFLSNELGSARLEDPDNGERVDAVISNIGADDLAGPGGNIWKGHATIVASLHPPTTSGQIKLVQSGSAPGSDRNDAALNAVAAAASKFVLQLKDYADNRALNH